MIGIGGRRCNISDRGLLCDVSVDRSSGNEELFQINQQRANIFRDEPTNCPIAKRPARHVKTFIAK